ncbi:MAG: hypothetical protein WAO76_03195 [Georgfuchsia sp.]
MDELKNLLISPAFWFASVVIAFLMSYLASYAKEWTDSWFQDRSAKKQAAARARQIDFEKKVEKLKANPLLLATYQANIVFQKLRQVLYLVPAYVSFALGIYSTINHQFGSAIAVLILSLAFGLVEHWLVSGHLAELKSVVNVALQDDEDHFTD